MNLCSRSDAIKRLIIGQPEKITYNIERRFAPLNQLASNIGKFDIKTQLNNFYDKFQPLWGRKNNPQSFGSLISEISATQPGSESMSSYTVPGSGITHITDSQSPIASTTTPQLTAITSSKETNKQDSTTSRSGFEDIFPEFPSSIPVSSHPVRTFSSISDRDRDHDRDWRDRERDRDRERWRDRDPYYSRGVRRDRPRRYRNRDRDRDIDPYGPYAPPAALFGIQVGESLKSHDRRTAAADSQSSSSSSSSSSQTPFPYPYPPYPFPYPFPTGVSPLSNPQGSVNLPAGYPPPYLNQIPGMSAAASHFHPLFSMLPPGMLATTAAPETTTTTPKPKKKKEKTRDGPETILEEDGTITIAGIKPQKIVNTIAEVVTRTGLNKAIGKAINTVMTQVSNVGSHVVHDISDSIRVTSGSDDSDHKPKPLMLPMTDTVLKLGDAKISFKPTRQGLSISFGKDHKSK